MEGYDTPGSVVSSQAPRPTMILTGCVRERLRCARDPGEWLLKGSPPHQVRGWGITTRSCHWSHSDPGVNEKTGTARRTLQRARERSTLHRESSQERMAQRVAREPRVEAAILPSRRTTKWAGPARSGL